jgi:hypothetical protein
MNLDVNLEDCIQDGGPAIPRLVSRLAHFSFPVPRLLPTDYVLAILLFLATLCAPTLSPLAAPTLFFEMLMDVPWSRALYRQPPVKLSLPRITFLLSVTGNCPFFFNCIHKEVQSPRRSKLVLFIKPCVTARNVSVEMAECRTMKTL